MPPWKGIIGKVFSVELFEDYCTSITWENWRPSFIVLHNTAIPSLAQRPNGLTIEHLHNLEAYYRDTKGWSGGPHLFIDDFQIWAFTPLTVPGVHSPSWNSVSLGIEMLGDFENESFTTGRGLNVRKNAIATISILTSRLGLDIEKFKLHKEDPLTTHACPGKGVRKLEIIHEVEDYLRTIHAGEHSMGLS
jgi:hypothetical protein